MTIHIVILCTNNFFNLGIRLVNNFIKYYIGNTNICFHLFTDQDPFSKINKNIINIDNIHSETLSSTQFKYKYYHTIHKSWQDGTNAKFSSILKVINYNNYNDYIFYLDADTNINKQFNEDLFIGDLVGAEHFDNETRMKYEKSYDRNKLSKAYIPYDTQLFQMYYQGAFFGGKINNINNFCIVLIYNQKYDKENLNYEPIWNDESYINNYFHYNKPKIIYYKDFPFIISDKDGMEDQRSFILDQNKETFIPINNNYSYQKLNSIKKDDKLCSNYNLIIIISILLLFIIIKLIYIYKL